MQPLGDRVTGAPRWRWRQPLERNLTHAKQSHEFISERARDASTKYGVKSVSLIARKP
jgi:hypothetical protein